MDILTAYEIRDVRKLIQEIEKTRNGCEFEVYANEEPCFPGLISGAQRNKYVTHCISARKGDYGAVIATLIQLGKKGHIIRIEHNTKAPHMPHFNTLPAAVELVSIARRHGEEFLEDRLRSLDSIVFPQKTVEVFEIEYD